jgi:hypothetical protein
MAGQTEQRLEQRAIKQGWPVPEGMKWTLMEKLADVVQEATTSQPRKLMAIAKVVVAVEKRNLEERRTAVAEERLALVKAGRPGADESDPLTVNFICEQTNQHPPAGGGVEAGPGDGGGRPAP